MYMLALRKGGQEEYLLMLLQKSEIGFICYLGCVMGFIFVLFQTKIERSSKDGSSTFASKSPVSIRKNSCIACLTITKSAPSFHRS